MIYFDGNVMQTLEKYVGDERFSYAYWYSKEGWVVVDKPSAAKLLKSGCCTALVYDAPPTYPTAHVKTTVTITRKELKWR